MTSSAPSSTRSCFFIPVSEIPNGSASSVIVALRRAATPRRQSGEIVLLRIGVVAGVASRYRLCVSAPDRSRSCRGFRLRQGRDLATGKLRWSSRFPDRGPGTYRARWALGGGFFPPLSFRIPSR